ncbi:MAG TPA: hypothetical protein VMI94_16765 [Bryobacteraceae bacterium]|nr:hypothetical protein [Bryobacteraceae bacterium]
MRNLVLAFLLPAAALVADCRFTLADQSNWNLALGFYFDLENSATGSAAYCQMANLTIGMGAADGSQWRFIGASPAWVTNHDYQVKVIVAPSYFEMYLDGQQLGHVDANFAGLPGQQLISGIPPYGSTGEADYRVSQSALTAQAGDGAPVSAVFQADTRPAGLAMLAPGTPSAPVVLGFRPADTLTFTATFRLTAQPANPNAYAPYIDAYGQSRYSDFTGKIQTDADLQTAAAQEQAMLAQWGMPSGFDTFGGVQNAGWQDTATGFFHLTRHNGVWWLISPAGNPCFYIGMDTGPLTTGNNTPVTNRDWEFAAMPPQNRTYSPAWAGGDWGNYGISSVSFDTWNMMRKYGTDSWQATATDLTVERMQAWGFLGFGKWSTPAGGLPILPVLWPNNVPVLVSHPDIFDSQIQADLRSSLQQQVAFSVNDPAILGWSFGNEYDELITPGEVQSILAMAGTVPAKRALIDDALSGIYGNNVAAMAAAWGVGAASVNDLYNLTPNPPAADIETLREYYEDQYYAFLYETVKSLDPNHLYFGTWIVPGWWINAIDWQLIAAHTDVIGYDRYSPVFIDSLLESMAQSAGKPIFLGEFSFPPHYNVERGYQIFPAAFAADDAGAGALYQANLESAARVPWCVGVAWFEYRDEPVAGRGYAGETDTDLVEGESYAFGMVDVADRPKYDLVKLVRTANLAAARNRLAFQAPVLNAGGTVNNASWAAAAPVAPGSLVSIFGTGLAGTNRTVVTMNGVAVPVIHAFPLQIDAQIPWEMAGQTQAQLSIVTDDLAGNTVSVPLAVYAPGIYTMNGSGSGQGAILLNGTATLAAPGHAARRGTDYVSIYATGLGPVSNPPASGAPASGGTYSQTIDSVNVSIGGAPATVSFAGLAPGWVGLYQVNVAVPADASLGDAAPVVLRMGGITSNTVTMAVQ